MKDIQLLLPSLLSDSAVFENMADVDWPAVYSMLVQQGVAAVAWDNVQRAMTEGGILPEQQLSKTQKIQWALATESIVKKYKLRKDLSIEISNIWAREGIKTYGLKGWALSTYYPKPELRECGDFDCWLGNDFQRGNQIVSNEK